MYVVMLCMLCFMLVLMAMNGILDLLNLLGKDKSHESGGPCFPQNHARVVMAHRYTQVKQKLKIKILC